MFVGGEQGGWVSHQGQKLPHARAQMVGWVLLVGEPRAYGPPVREQWWLRRGSVARQGVDAVAVTPDEVEGGVFPAGEVPAERCGG